MQEQEKRPAKKPSPVQNYVKKLIPFNGKFFHRFCEIIIYISESEDESDNDKSHEESLDEDDEDDELL